MVFRCTVYMVVSVCMRARAVGRKSGVDLVIERRRSKICKNITSDSVHVVAFVSSD